LNGIARISLRHDATGCSGRQLAPWTICASDRGQKHLEQTGNSQYQILDSGKLLVAIAVELLFGIPALPPRGF